MICFQTGFKGFSKSWEELASRLEGDGVPTPVTDATKDTTCLKPLLKWAGGKRWLLPTLRPLWEPHKEKRLVEPFAGGLAVALGLRPKQTLLNDINSHLINFYIQVQNGLTIDLDLCNEKDTYYEYRERFNKYITNGKVESKEAAELFYYLNKTGYNGLCRFNNGGTFNVPFGRYKNIGYVTDFSDYVETFSEWEFTAKDFLDIKLEETDFLYCDPPYDSEESGFTQYSEGGFSWTDQVLLAGWVARHKGPAIISNAATPRVKRLYKSLGFDLEYLDGPRFISCNGNRDKAKEVLAKKGL